MTKSELFIGFCMIGIVLLLGIYHLRLMIIHGVWLYLLLLYICSFSIFGLIVWRLRKSHDYHSHHYFNFLLLLPLTCFNTVLSSVTQAMILGSCIEGIACWGMDPILHDSMSKSSDFSVHVWTVILMSFNLKRKRWYTLLTDLHMVCAAMESLSKKLNKDLINELQIHTKLQRASAILRDIKYFKIKHNPDKISSNALRILHLFRFFKDEDVLVAWAETVSFGLFVGRQELRKAAKKQFKVGS